MIWLLGLAWAEQPFPAYDEVVIIRTWDKMNNLIEAACHGPIGSHRICVDAPLDEAIQLGLTFEREVVPDARITYMVGLAQLTKGARTQARASFQAAIKQDPKRVDAWNDLGELALKEGDLQAAQVAFENVNTLLRNEKQSWLGPWRLAEVAAHRKQPEIFESQMRIALERGFSFRYIKGLPNWRGFLADETMGPSVRKLLTVYSTPDVLRSLEPQSTKPRRP